MKAKNYREVKGQAYTRKEFIRGPPQPKINKFSMGDPNVKYNMRLSLIALEGAQIRHSALEAGRVAANRVLQEKLGENFFFKVYPYPHIILRENKMIFGAHADRLQDGMRKAFGKPIGSAARVKPNQPVMSAYVNEDAIEAAKEALKRGAAKLPIPCRITVESLKTLEADA